MHPPSRLPVRFPGSRRVLAAGVLVLVAGLAASTAAGPSHPAGTGTRGHPGARLAATEPAASTTPLRATTTAPPTTTTTTTLGPGFVAGQVTAIGDSVMLDYQTPLQADIPGVNVQAAVSRQWTAGYTIVRTDRADVQLGATVVIALGTNGPITTTDFNTMMSLLDGATRVVFVNIVVDRPWQDANNAVLAAGVGRYPNTVLVDWNTLAAQNPGWLYTTGTHLPIDGPGAQALAALIASKVGAPG
jgi:hypothetical protein